MKYIKYLSYILLAISAIIIIVFYTSGFSDGTLSLVLNWAFILMGVALLGAIILPMFFSTGKGIKGTLIKFGVVVVLCVVSYFAASGDPVQVTTNVEATGSELKLTDAGLIMTTILFVIAVLAILSSSVMSTIRNR